MDYKEYMKKSRVMAVIRNVYYGKLYSDGQWLNENGVKVNLMGWKVICDWDFWLCSSLIGRLSELNRVQASHHRKREELLKRETFKNHNGRVVGIIKAVLVHAESL